MSVPDTKLTVNRLFDCTALSETYTANHRNTNRRIQDADAPVLKNSSSDTGLTITVMIFLWL
ncbi:MAG: hypothetical protein ACLUFM_05675 [Lachnospiraceae bacterium]